VLNVILRKAEAIRKATGVTVPLPEERGAVTSALMNAVMLRKGRTRQLSLDLDLASAVAAVETRWRDAAEGERRSRARFAQNVIRLEEVAPEWQRWRALLGGPDQVRRFVERAMSRLDAPLEPAKANTARAHVAALPSAISERLAARGLTGSIRLAFVEPAPAGAEMIGRSHALPATLAEALLEGALDPRLQPDAAARARRCMAHPRREDADHNPAAAATAQADCPCPARAVAARGGSRGARLRGERG